MSSPSSYKRAGRSGQRYRKQINHKRYEKYLHGNELERTKAYEKWVESLIATHKNRITDKSLTFTTFKQMFIDELRSIIDKNTGKPKYKNRTIDEYLASLEDFDNKMKLQYINDLTYPILAAYRRKLKDQARAKKSNNYGINKKMGCNIRAFKWGMAEGFIPVINTTPLEENLDTGKVVPHTITIKEIALLVKYSPLKWQIAIKIGFYTGIRPEEMINLIKSKIDFQTGILKIQEHDENKALGIKEWAPKRNKRRPLFLPTDVLEDIKKLNPKTYIILNDEGKPYSENNFSNSFKSNLNKVNKQIRKYEADTPPIRCSYKTLRKSNISVLMDKGLDENDASLNLGHADKKTSEKHYIDPQVLEKQKEEKQLKQLEKIKSYLLELPTALYKEIQQKGDTK